MTTLETMIVKRLSNTPQSAADLVQDSSVDEDPRESLELVLCLAWAEEEGIAVNTPEGWQLA